MSPNIELTVCPADLAATDAVFIKKPSKKALVSKETMGVSPALFIQEALVAQDLSLNNNPPSSIAAYNGIVLSPAGKLIVLAYKRYGPRPLTNSNYLSKSDKFTTLHDVAHHLNCQYSSRTILGL